mmetsp:Transcript_19423/g.74571  ORF Transcript_19423/g.74571 Transcript_19423/m.74571 type:complete len:348 (+) Transcript_19423:2314-3357(+)
MAREELGRDPAELCFVLCLFHVFHVYDVVEGGQAVDCGLADLGLGVRNALSHGGEQLGANARRRSSGSGADGRHCLGTNIVVLVNNVPQQALLDFGCKGGGVGQDDASALDHLQTHFVAQMVALLEKRTCELTVLQCHRRRLVEHPPDRTHCSDLQRLVVSSDLVLELGNDVEHGAGRNYVEGLDDLVVRVAQCAGGLPPHGLHEEVRAWVLQTGGAARDQHLRQFALALAVVARADQRLEDYRENVVVERLIVLHQRIDAQAHDIQHRRHVCARVHLWVVDGEEGLERLADDRDVNVDDEHVGLDLCQRAHELARKVEGGSLGLVQRRVERKEALEDALQLAIREG